MPDARSAVRPHANPYTGPRTDAAGNYERECACAWSRTLVNKVASTGRSHQRCAHRRGAEPFRHCCGAIRRTDPANAQSEGIKPFALPHSGAPQSLLALPSTARSCRHCVPHRCCSADDAPHSLRSCGRCSASLLAACGRSTTPPFAPRLATRWLRPLSHARACASLRATLCLVADGPVISGAAHRGSLRDTLSQTLRSALRSAYRR